MLKQELKELKLKQKQQIASIKQKQKEEKELLKTNKLKQKKELESQLITKKENIVKKEKELKSLLIQIKNINKKITLNWKRLDSINKKDELTDIDNMKGMKYITEWQKLNGEFERINNLINKLQIEISGLKKEFKEFKIKISLMIKQI